MAPLKYWHAADSEDAYDMRKQLKPKKGSSSKERTGQPAPIDNGTEPEEDGINHDMDDNSSSQLAASQADDATSQASAVASGGAAGAGKKKKKKVGADADA
jgi:hypothetical protein